MSKSKKTTDTVATTLSNIAGSITSPSLTKVDRGHMRSRNARVPDELVEMICHLAEQGNGSVLGMPFDATAARATLAQTSTTRTTISVGRQTLQRMEDDMIQKRATVADPVFAIYTSLQRFSKTKAGNALLPAYEQMKAIVKKTRSPKRPATPGETPGEATATAPAADTVAAPAAPPPSPQAPAPKAVATPSN